MHFLSRSSIFPAALQVTYRTRVARPPGPPTPVLSPVPRPVASNPANRLSSRETLPRRWPLIEVGVTFLSAGVNSSRKSKGNARRVGVAAAVAACWWRAWRRHNGRRETMARAGGAVTAARRRHLCDRYLSPSNSSFYGGSRVLFIIRHVRSKSNVRLVDSLLFRHLLEALKFCKK